MSRLRRAPGPRDALSAVAAAAGHVLLRRGPTAGRGFVSGETPVIIAGMHRSGTSIISRLLERAGLYVGGSWVDENHESIHFSRANRAMLGEGAYMVHDFGWTAPKTGDFIAARRGYAERAARNTAVFFADRDGQVAWGWKDPRNSLTLPVWLALYPDARVLHIVRDGRAVALSLTTRDDLDPAFAIELWGHYALRAERALDAVPAERKLIVRYEDVMAGPAGVLPGLVAFCGLPPVSDLDRITSGLNPSRATDPLSDPRVAGLPRHPLLEKYGYA